MALPLVVVQEVAGSDVKRHVVWSRVKMSKAVMPSGSMVGA